MSQLVLPHSIEAGTEIVAAEHQDNYVAIRDIINGNLDIDNLADTLKALIKQTAEGVVASDGSITSGSGFSVVHSATGVYAMTFSPIFAAPPGISITTVGIQRFIGITSGPTASSFQVTFSNSIAGAGVDTAFSFTAIGRRV